MKKRILVLEDLEVSRKAVVKMVKECGDDPLVYDFADVAGAFECTMENRIDLFLIDIVLKPTESNDFPGIQFAQTIREISKYATAEIIFITTLAGLEADLLRKVHCFDYIEKPLSRERVQKVVKEALRKLDMNPMANEWVYLRKDKVTYPIKVSEILYLESKDRMLNVHLKDEVVEIPHLSLKKCLDKIQSNEFLMSAKGIAVNANYIEFVDTTNRFVKIKGMDTMLDIGERMKESFMKAFYKFGNVEEP